MKRIAAVIALVFASTGCQVQIGKYLYAELIGTDIPCESLYDHSAIPCGEVLAYCAEGNADPQLLPEVYDCGPESATFADLCAVPGQLHWYGYRPEDCPTPTP